MNTEERVLSAIRRERTDRIPVVLFLNPYDPGHWACQDPSYAEVLEAMKTMGDPNWDYGLPEGFMFSHYDTRAEERLLANGDREVILHTPKGPLTAVYGAGGRGRKRLICSIEDAKKALSIPDASIETDYREFFMMRDKMRGRAITQIVSCDPICIMLWIDEMVGATWTRLERPLLREMLDTAHRRIRANLEHALKAGLGPLFYFNGPEFALPPLMTPDDFQEFVVEYDRDLIALIKSYGRLTMIHSHGRVSNFLERFAAIGMDCLNVLEPPPIGDTNLADAKRRIGDRVCLMGNVQYDDIARGTPEHIERLVREAIEQGGPKGFILSPCASPYERDLTPRKARNLIHFLEMGNKYGKVASSQ